MKKAIVIAVIFSLSTVPLQAVAMTTPLLISNSSAAGVLSNSAVRYVPFAPNGGTSGFQPNATEGVVDTPIAIAGTVSDMRVHLSNALIGAGTYGWKFRKNGAFTGLEASTTNASQFASDLVTQVAVAPGDLLAIAIHPNGTPTSVGTDYHVSFKFVSTIKGESIIQSGVSSLSNTAVNYTPLGVTRAASATENLRTSVMPTSGVIDQLYVDLNTSLGAGTQYVFTMRVNGVDTGLTCTIVNVDSDCNDLVTGHAVNVSAGQLISFSATPSGTPTSVSAMIGVRFVPTISGESVMFDSGGNPSGTLVNYLYTGGIHGTDTVSASTTSIAPVAFTWRKLYLDFNTAPGNTRSRAVSGFLNSATTTLTATVSNTATTASDIVNEISVAAGDILNWTTAPTNSPTAPTQMRASAVMYIATPDTAPATQKTFLNIGKMILNAGRLIFE